MLALLAKKKREPQTPFIFRYLGPDGKPYIQIPKFNKHQRITGKEAQAKSDIPEPSGSEWEAIGKQLGNNGETSETTGREGKGKERKGLSEKNSLGVISEKDDYKIRTPGQQVMAAYKLLTGVAIDDRTWDGLYYPKFSRYRVELLKFFGGNVEMVVKCMEGIKKWAEGKGIDWTLATVAKRASDWKTGRLYGPKS
jgi:hypothetical protein